MDTPDRLTRLRKVRDALEPQVLDIKSRSEHGLQGASGVIGQYLRVLEQIEELEKAQPAEKGTVLDELASRRAGRPAPTRQTRAAKRQ